MKLIYLEWEDAMHNGEWFSEDMALAWSQRSKTIIKECGYIVEETKEYITIASRYHGGDELHDITWGGLQKIPKGWIRNRKTIKV